MDFLQINQALFFYYQHIVTFSGNPNYNKCSKVKKGGTDRTC